MFENIQNSFSYVPPFGLFWSVKYLNFGQKLPIPTTCHTFLESRYPEVTKNPYYVFLPWGEPKEAIRSWTITSETYLFTKKKKKMKVAFSNTMLRHFGAAPANTSEKNMAIGG